MTFVEWLKQLFAGMRLWATVRPWEQGVRLTMGKRRKLLGPGMWWKVPILQQVLIYPIRTRTVGVDLQRLRTSDGRTVTVGMAIKFRIDDLCKVLDTLHNPGMTLAHMAQDAVSTLVNETAATDITSPRIHAAAHAKVNPAQYGIGDFAVLVTDNADLSAKTFSLIQGNRSSGGEGYWGEVMDGMERKS